MGFALGPCGPSKPPPYGGESPTPSRQEHRSVLPPYPPLFCGRSGPSGSAHLQPASFPPDDPALTPFAPSLSTLFSLCSNNRCRTDILCSVLPSLERSAPSHYHRHVATPVPLTCIRGRGTPFPFARSEIFTGASRSTPEGRLRTDHGLFGEAVPSALLIR